MPALGYGSHDILRSAAELARWLGIAESEARDYWRTLGGQRVLVSDAACALRSLGLLGEPAGVPSPRGEEGEGLSLLAELEGM
jgi:hypothetical protein